MCNIERVRIEPCLFRSKVSCVLKFEGTTLHARLREAGSSQLAKKKKKSPVSGTSWLNPKAFICQEHVWSKWRILLLPVAAYVNCNLCRLRVWWGLSEDLHEVLSVYRRACDSYTASVCVFYPKAKRFFQSEESTFQRELWLYLAEDWAIKY